MYNIAKYVGILLICIVLVGCETYQPKEMTELTRNIVEAAKEGNVSGTLHIDLEASGEVWQRMSFGIGNPHSRISGDLQFRFDKEKAK